MASVPVALVPVRDPDRGKSRLRTAQPADARRALVTAMLTDVVLALQGSSVDRIVVLAGGPAAAAAARALGVDSLPDPPGGGLDRALEAAAGRIRADVSLVVPADLPLLQPQDVEEVLGTPGDVVVVPTSDGGTGCLLRRPAWVLPTEYGGRSAARHLLAARRNGLSATRVDVAGFGTDVDLAADLDTVAAAPTLGATTARVLRSLGLRSA